MIANALDGKPLPVYGDGQNVRDWLYVDDHCAAIRARARARPARRDLQHRRQRGDAPTSTSCTRSATCCDELRPARATIARQITFVTDRPGHDRRYAIDARKIRARARLEARARRSRRGIAQTVRWYLDNPAWVGERAERRVPRTGSRRNYARDASAHDDEAQRHHPRRRLRHAALSGHARRHQAAAAGLRQADDLLPAVDADAGGHPRHPGHLHAAGHAALRSSCSATAREWGLDISLRGAAVARRAGAGVHHRPRVRRRRRRRRWCSATTSSTATTSQTQLAARERAGATARRCSPIRCTIRSATAWSSSTRDGPRRRPRGEARAAEVALRGDRPLLLRQPRARHRGATQAVARAASSRSPTSTARYLARGRARRAR